MAKQKKAEVSAQEQEQIDRIKRVEKILAALRVANIGLQPQTVQAILNPSVVKLVQRLDEVFENNSDPSLGDINKVVEEIAEFEKEQAEAAQDSPKLEKA